MWETRSVFHISMPLLLGQDCLRRRWPVAQRRMRPHRVVQPRHETPIKPTFERSLTFGIPGMGNECWFVARHAEAAVSLCGACAMNSWGFPILEIPEWMFDSNLCGRMKPAETPRVDCAALLALKHLLSAATECGQQDMVQAQQDSSSSGNADAQAVSAQEPSRRVVFSSSEASRIAHRSAAKDGPTLGQDVERTLAPSLRGHDTGGGR